MDKLELLILKDLKKFEMVKLPLINENKSGPKTTKVVMTEHGPMPNFDTTMFTDPESVLTWGHKTSLTCSTDPSFYMQSINGCFPQFDFHTKTPIVPFSKLLNPKKFKFLGRMTGYASIYEFCNNEKTVHIRLSLHEKHIGGKVLFYSLDIDIDAYSKLFPEIKEDTKKANAKIIIKGDKGLQLMDNNIDPFDLKIGKHYNDNIKKFDDHMKKWDSWDKPNKRLVLLYGEAGTGKTNWLKEYMKSVKRQVIFIPPALATCISNPDFVKFMYRHRGSLLIIEDAEQILESRNNTRDTTVSDILNLTDGMMADFLDLRIIATHNKDKSWIDSALRRPGRCYAEQEFARLNSDKTTKLCKSLKIKPSREEMTLAEIYNEHETTEGDKIGF